MPLARLRSLFARRRPRHPRLVVTVPGGQATVVCDLPDFSARANDDVVAAATDLAAVVFVLMGPLGVAEAQRAVARAAVRRDEEFFAAAFLVAVNAAAALPPDPPGPDHSPVVRAAKTLEGPGRD